MVISSCFAWHRTTFSGLNNMRCLSCNCNLSDREANRKYSNHEEIKNPESRYIGLCDDCIIDTDLAFIEDTGLSNDRMDLDDNEPVVHDDEFTVWSER